MSSFVESLKRGRTWVIVSLILVLFPMLSFLYFAWLTDFQWWSANDWEWSSGASGEDTDTRHYRQDVENVNYQLANVHCPAKEGLELRDYWRCLWRTSITAEGLEQDKRIRWQYYLERLNAEREVMESWHNKTMELEAAEGNINKKQSRRRNKRSLRDEKPLDSVYRWRRQTGGAPPPPPLKSNGTPADVFILDKMQSILKDTYIAFDPRFRSELKTCQQQVSPAVSIQNFLTCVRKISFSPGLDHRPGAFGNSFNPIFAPTEIPELGEHIYDEQEFPLLKMKNRRNQTYKFTIEFDPLEDEEKQNNFFGADPYFNDQWSPYRYHYNSLNERQSQPGWTYGGLHGSKEWHKLGLERFLMPLKDKTDLSKIALLTEFAQTYPGVGEVVDSLKDLDNPMSVRWNKDSGEYIYTRYVLPLLDVADLAYYKNKGLVDASVEVKSDQDQLQLIIEGMDKYKNLSSEWLAKWDAATQKVSDYNDAKYPKWEDAPFAEAYRRIITQYFGVDTALYLEAKRKILGERGNYLYAELEIIRWLIRAYVDAVRGQEVCLKQMVSESGVKRFEDEADLHNAITNAMLSKECNTASNFTEAVAVDPNIKDDMEYKLTNVTLKQLYDRYYNMKDARERYSLPQYPVEFPICKHNDPSPIDIRTDTGRQSTVKDYSFGDAAYRLNRFFMFFPLDGSPLLTVGIVDGERLDLTAVPLKGGAVRGQYLTFQYMHIRFSRDWKSVGSEHTIDGEGAPMELQMIFTLGGSADAIKYWHILARVQNRLFQFREKLVIILSVLVDVLETDNEVVKKVKEEHLGQDPYLFEPLAQAAYHFRRVPELYPTYEQPRGYVSVDPVFRFIDFIPSKASYFYTYRGSLSWPPCFAYVIWSVYQQRLYMSKRQFDQFAKIPAFGVQGDNFAHDNVRKFEDIYVEEESNPSLTNAMVEELKKQRTVDRYILVGWHEGADANKPELNGETGHSETGGHAGVVGDVVYDMDFGSNGVTLDLAGMYVMVGVALMNSILF